MIRQLILLLCFPVLTNAYDLAGTWQGRIRLLVFDADVRLIVKFEKDTVTQEWTAEIDVPGEDVKKEYVDVELEGDSLTLDFPTFGGDYTARYNNDSAAFIGYYRQMGYKIYMKLVKGEADDLLYNRPQKPKKPYPYFEEEVTVRNKKAGLTLAGTFSRPNEPGKYPVVVMITGSGPEDRDETVFGHKPFLVIADYLTRRGFAVLRCDDRGTAKSTGDFYGNSGDYASDVAAQVDYLKTRSDIDPKRIGLIGHSEGGIIAPYVAIHRKDIAFMVLLAGPAMDLFDLLSEQQVLVMKASKMSDDYIKDIVDRNKVLYAYVRQSRDSAMAADSIDNYLRSKKVSDPEIALALRQVDSRWMRFFIGYDPVKTLKKVKCPVLALNGDKDVQVPASMNIPGIERGLSEGGNKNYETKILPGLNHLFQQCKKCTVGEYVQLEQTMSPEVLTIMGDWLARTAR